MLVCSSSPFDLASRSPNQYKLVLPRLQITCPYHTVANKHHHEVKLYFSCPLVIRTIFACSNSIKACKFEMLIKCLDSSSPLCRPDRPMSTMQLMLFDPGYRLTDDFQLSANLTAFRRGRLSQAGAYLDDVENLCVRAYVCVCTCVYVRARVPARARACVRLCVHAQHARDFLISIHPSIHTCT